MAVYDVPLVSSNLRPEEMIIQMADTLEFLEQVSNDVFSRVGREIQKTRTRINDIHKRVEVAQAKTDGLKGSRKATQIFSSSRFPGTFTSESQSIFHNTDIKFQRTHQAYNNAGKGVLEGDVVFYPTHLPNGIKHQTLAPPSSASELLIFNTEDLAFQQQSLPDKSSKFVSRRKHDSEMSVDVSIGDAPWSISQREQLERSNPLNFSYIPGLGDVPELDLPLALPDLPGVADDLAYNEDVGPGIAPSLMAVLPDLSQLTESRSLKSSPVPPPPPPTLSLPTTPVPPPAPPTQTTILPPPPVPTNQLPSVLPPPPPPPPPPALAVPSQSEPVVSIAGPPVKTNLPPTDGLRSNLMAAIREAGGAGKLKSSTRAKHTQAVKEQQQQNATNKSTAPPSQTPAGNLMADLFNKLSMRRKGISGQNSETVGPMDRISAMIPPPPNPAGGANVSSSDDIEDWK